MKWSRRDFVGSLSAAALLARAEVAAATCSVARSRVGGFASKSYTCGLGGGRELTATFMRMSDLMFDVARADYEPNWMPRSIQTVRALQSGALDAFYDLFSRYARSIERPRLGYTYINALGEEADGRQAPDQPDGRSDHAARTLGVWDHTWSAPTFPLPRELERAHWIARNGPRHRDFLRFANRADFDDLDVKLDDYARTLRSRYAIADSAETMMDWFKIGNLALLRHIDGGAMDRFIPLFAVNEGGCGILDAIGILYDPPALFVDIAIFENSGTAPFLIDDILGETDPRTQLRPYSTAVARDLTPLGQEVGSVAPGESVLLVQRLLFGALKELFADTGAERAVFGPTQLPTGVLIDGQAVAFDGRSHNALLMASYLPATCCPFLDYYCPDRQDWISVGNILGGADGLDAADTHAHRFDGFIATFRLAEHEPEISTISDIVLTLELSGDLEIDLLPTAVEFPVRIDFLESVILCFALPDGIASADILSSRLSVSGYYVKYDADNFAKAADVSGAALS